MTRVVQISDTHLGARKQHFEPNWAPVATWLAAERPAIVIHTGDVTLDGAGEEADMRHGAARLATLPAPVLAVPGNHDVGEAGHPHQPVNQERLERWRRHFGPDWWLHDIDAWRLIGLDSMVFGAAIAAEAEQQAWLEDALAGADGRRVAVFTHRPLWIERPEEPDTGYWSVKPAQRRALLDLFGRHGVALVATGHLHRSHDTTHGGCRYIWGAASGFLVGPACAPPLPGEARLGAVIYDFEAAEVRITRTEVPGLSDFWIDDVVHEVYPPPPG